MQIIAAQDIKKRGIAAVDALALEDYRAGRYTVYESADTYLAEVDKMLEE